MTNWIKVKAESDLPDLNTYAVVRFDNKYIPILLDNPRHLHHKLPGDIKELQYLDYSERTSGDIIIQLMKALDVSPNQPNKIIRT